MTDTTLKERKMDAYVLLKILKYCTDSPARSYQLKYAINETLITKNNLTGWQDLAGFRRGKNGHETFRQARIYNFRDKCVVFARNLKFSNLTQ